MTPRSGWRSTLAIITPLLAAASQFACNSATPTPPWTASPQRITELETRWGTESVNYREEKVAPFVLPDPLQKPAGVSIVNKDDWEKSPRLDVLNAFASQVYGRTPPGPFEVRCSVLSTEPDALDGTANFKRIAITSSNATGTFTFDIALFTPNNAAGPVPVFLLINNRTVSAADPSRASRTQFWPVEEIIRRGYATAVMRTADVDPDDRRPEARAKGVRGVWPDGGGSAATGDAWGSLGVWAWGASRTVDYLITDPAIDAHRVAVVGHSRGGKAALWAGAQDKRFALTVSNESGAGGAALARRNFGETVRHSVDSFPYWYAQNYAAYRDNERSLPVDQHELIALIAPRAVYVASAADDLWSDPRGEFLALAGATSVYALYGLPGFDPAEMPPLDTSVARGHVGFHVRSAQHDLVLYDWEQFMAFGDRLWKRPAKQSVGL